MPQFVRAGLRSDRWLETDGPEPLNFPADVLDELRTKGNHLSVFEVSETVSAERIAIAFFATGKKEPYHTAYGVFDRGAVEAIGITVEKTPGETIDVTVNEQHFDLHVGTTGKLVALAGVIAAGNIIPLLREDVTRLVKDGFASSRLDHKKNKFLCDKVKAQIPTPPVAPSA